VRDGCRAHKILKASHVRSCLFYSSILIISFVSCMLFRRSFYVGTVNQSHEILTTLTRICTRLGGPALTNHPSWMCWGSMKCAGTDGITTSWPSRVECPQNDPYWQCVSCVTMVKDITMVEPVHVFTFCIKESNKNNPATFRCFIASFLLVTELLSVCGAVVLGRLCNSNSAAPHERPGPLPNEQTFSRNFAVPSFRLQKGCRLGSTATQIHSYRPSP
jgi:hypothetical protein